ncbi:dGTPase [Methanococcus maripaludis]|uniref:dGTPase n=1 Tax=Methanococcus maripaludis TaxID=39152 RepID=A0A7J9S7Z1_METMI|nr:dNTP triphosphohydrolase [Methanococcus maripaludis]MBB6402430.1 dGTPase [Methanococcus maripaludis]
MDEVFEYSSFREYVTEELAQKSDIKKEPKHRTKSQNEKFNYDRRYPKSESGEMELITSEYISRNDFERDRNRIMFLKSFRRLEHKAQIYSHEKGDHYRTRLTHTLEVLQISRSLGRNLGLNENLIEAIALGHDLGHTPFGHQGERVLDQIMNGVNNLGGKIEYGLNHGGFKHNFQSLKLLDILEQKHQGKQGMNLSWQVLEGILKHTRIKRCKHDRNCEGVCTEGGCWDINKFIQEPDGKYSNFLKDLLEYEFSVTLEGQVVAIADEIAQRQHDLDDGLRDSKLGLKYQELVKSILFEIKKRVKLLKKDDPDLYRSLKQESNDLLDNMKDNLKSTKIPEKITDPRRENCIRDFFMRTILDYFIKDVTFNSFENLIKVNNNPENYIINKNGKNYFKKEKLIYFSPLGKLVNDIIEDLVKKIHASYNVSRFDAKAEFVIKQIYKAYYNNPKQLPNEILKEMETRLNNNLKKYKLYSEINFEKDNILHQFDFSKGIPSNIEKMLKLDVNALKNLDLINKNYCFIDEYMSCEDDLVLECYDSESNREEQIFVTTNSVKRNDLIKKYKIIYSKKINEVSGEELFIKWLLENNYIFMSTICDHMASMTDNYANNEYKELYLL